MTEIERDISTLAIHGGRYRCDRTTGALATPIYQTTSYQFRDSEHAARLFSLDEIGHIYTRVSNPTTAVFEERMAAIEGGTGALACASGQAASTIAIFNLASSGDNIVASEALFGSTVTLFTQTLSQFGIEVRMVSPSDPENFARASDGRTRAFFGETIANPRLEVFPIREVANVGGRLGIPLIIDNTGAPIIARPILHGAAVVVHSATKYIGGSGASIGGVIVDGDNFPWTRHADRFPLITQPDASYHGVVWTELAKQEGRPGAFIIRARARVMRDLGATLSPMTAFQFLQGLESLPLRIQRQCENASQVAAFLSQHEQIASVVHPSLQTGANRMRADEYLNGRYGALIGCELLGGKEAGRRFIDSLKMICHVANLGDARTLAIHPASTTHQQLTERERLASGVTLGYVRLSMGLEHPRDIIADISQALDAARIPLRLAAAAV